MSVEIREASGADRSAVTALALERCPDTEPWMIELLFTDSLAFDAFVRVFSNDNPLMRVVRGAGLAVVNQIAPARRFFMHEAGGGVGDLPKLLRGESL